MTKLTWLLIALLIAGHLVVDLMVPHMFMFGPDAEWLLAGVMGLCVGQITLIGVWAAMAPGRVILRLPWSMLLATLMWYALVIGNRTRGLFDSPWAYGTFRAEDALLLGLILLAGVVVVQIPLWIASRLLRWRLIPPTLGERREIDEHQFNIKHLIAGMLIVSIALGLGRVILPQGKWQITGIERELLFILPTVGIVNVLVAVPCIWGAFVRGALVIPLAFMWIFYALLVSILEVGTLIAFLRPPGGSDIWWVMTLFNLAQCLSVFATLALLRLIGFQLVRTNRSIAQPDVKGTCDSPADVR